VGCFLGAGCFLAGACFLKGLCFLHVDFPYRGVSKWAVPGGELYECIFLYRLNGCTPPYITLPTSNALSNLYSINVDVP